MAPGLELGALFLSGQSVMGVYAHVPQVGPNRLVRSRFPADESIGCPLDDGIRAPKVIEGIHRGNQRAGARPCAEGKVEQSFVSYRAVLQ